jgi:hypothetical protein
MHLVAERYIFLFIGRYDRGFLKEVIKTYQMAPMSPLNFLNIFFCHHTFSLRYSPCQQLAEKTESSLTKTAIFQLRTVVSGFRAITLNAPNCSAGLNGAAQREFGKISQTNGVMLGLRVKKARVYLTWSLLQQPTITSRSGDERPVASCDRSMFPHVVYAHIQKRKQNQRIRTRKRRNV